MTFFTDFARQFEFEDSVARGQHYLQYMSGYDETVASHNRESYSKVLESATNIATILKSRHVLPDMYVTRVDPQVNTTGRGLKLKASLRDVETLIFSGWLLKQWVTRRSDTGEEYTSQALSGIAIPEDASHFAYIEQRTQAKEMDRHVYVRPNLRFLGQPALSGDSRTSYEVIVGYERLANKTLHSTKAPEDILSQYAHERSIGLE